MATRRNSPEESVSLPRRRRPPATTVEARENQLISKALDVIDRQMDDGTVSSQVLSLYAKLGTTREREERKRLENENKLLEAKIESLESAVRMEDLYGKAIKAMRQYSGQEVDSEDEDY